MPEYGQPIVRSGCERRLLTRFRYWLNYGFWFVRDYGSFQWRFPIAFQMGFSVILIIGVLL